MQLKFNFRFFSDIKWFRVRYCLFISLFTCINFVTPIHISLNFYSLFVVVYVSTYLFATNYLYLPYFFFFFNRRYNAWWVLACLFTLLDTYYLFLFIYLYLRLFVLICIFIYILHLPLFIHICLFIYIYLFTFISLLLYSYVIVFIFL